MSPSSTRRPVTSVKSDPAVRRKVVGSHPSSWANTTFSMAARKKIGMQVPRSEPETVPKSIQVPRRFAARYPSGMPRPTAMSMAAKESSMVAGSRSASSVAMGRPLDNEDPKSRRTTRPRNSPYWVQTGSSRPREARSASRCCVVAFSGSSRFSGPPGRALNHANSSSESPKSATDNCRRRLTV